MPFVNGFVNLAMLTNFRRRIQLGAQQERCGLLSGLAVVLLQDVRVGLQEEADVGMADAVTDHFRVHTGLQRRRSVRVTEIVEGDPREPCRGR